mmetsp:Transcript_14660/g.38873  ORF Transcript_14660/g.38873 Transcript_14660/m.38873 type:complete len:399 (+) Transcript_14660:62-1258(+)
MARKEKTPTWQIALLVAGMLTTGTLNTLTTKIQFSQFSVDSAGHLKQFQKPWYGTFNMMFAMSLVGLIDMAFRRCRKGGGAAEEPLMEQKSRHSYAAKVWMVMVPAVFDLMATALCCVGMLYIPASVWQMLRGSSIVFCAVLSIAFLKRKMYAFNWIGLGMCCAGVSLVGLANVWGSARPGGDTSDQSNLVYGMSLVVLGQVVQAGQVIAEEFLMKDMDLPAMQVVGIEGYWGVAWMILIVYPLLYFLPGDDFGHMEDPVDTYTMVYNSFNLQCTVGLYLVSCGTFNATGIAVTGALSGIHRMMLDASRTIVIWAFGLMVHYCIDPHSLFGEVWTDYSPLQLVGFLVIVLGQATYGEVLKVPGLKYPLPLASPGPMDAAMWASPGAAMNLCSPPPRRA